MDMIPGAPMPRDIQSDSIEIDWEKPKCQCPDGLQYEIRYKEVPNSKWIYYKETDRACVRVKGLKSGCSYKFKVKAVNEGSEGLYSPESTEIRTKATPASTLLDFTIEVEAGQNGMPSKRCLPSTEIINARNPIAKTRKFEVGRPPLTGAFEKTILLVGETGSGKSTLVDGFINYIFGVNYEDPYRFKLVDLESDEKGKSQAFAQTEWITCYAIHPGPGSRIPYTLNIVDTPGFGDTKGIDRDKKIFDQLRELFSSKEEKGVVFIDAACFFMKAPDARLTQTQKYIYSSVLSLFGKNIKDNVCALITFADSKEPPVLSAMKEAKLPIESMYVFNNSGLFKNNDSTSNARMFWEMGIESFQQFFKGLEKMKTKSLQQTKEVLEYRKKVEVTISNLQPLIDAGLKQQEEIRKEMQIIEEHESEIAANENFTYTVEETHLQKSDLPNGEFATNCLNCKLTCHVDCWRRKDFLNYFCSAMNLLGNCTVCDGKCSFLRHTNEPSIYRFVTKEVTKTYDDQLKKYGIAKEKKLTHEQFMEEKKKDLKDLETDVHSMMEEVNEWKNVLSEIALQPNVISMKEHIDLMIQTAEMEKIEGYQERIAALKRHQEMIQIDEKFARFHEGNAATNDLENQQKHKLKRKLGKKKEYCNHFF